MDEVELELAIALVYTLDIVQAAPEEVARELSRPDVLLAVVVEVTAEGVFGPRQVAMIADANQFALRLGEEDVTSVMDDLLTSSWGKEWSQRYEVDFRAGQLVDMDPGGLRMMDLASSGIQLPSPKGPGFGRLEYECDNTEHHRVRRAPNSRGQICGEQLADGSACPGALELV